jgi:hypothetical protein
VPARAAKRVEWRRIFAETVPKTEQTQQKPVESGEMPLTKDLKRLKVNCGTVLCTRMNIEDFGLNLRAGEVGRSVYIFEINEGETRWQRE